MSVTVDQVIQRYVLDDRFSAKARQVQRSAAGIGTATSGTSRGLANFSSLAKSAGSTISGVFTGIGNVAQVAFSVVTKSIGFVLQGIEAVISAAGIMAIAVLGFGGMAIKAASDMDSLKRGLLSVAGSTEEAAKQFERLKQVAKLPGLGLKEAIEGSIALQAAGINASLAERALMSFGNALARVGRGREDLDGLIRALTQINDKTSISAEEINQIAERLPGIRRLMKDAFGTSNTEELQKRGLSPKEFIEGIVAEAEKLPKMTAGIKVTLENLQDSIFRTMATIGDALAERVLPVFETLNQFLEYSVESGLVDKITRGFTEMFAAPGKSGVVGVLAQITATLEELPTLLTATGKMTMYILQSIAQGFIGVYDMIVNAHNWALKYTPQGWLRQAAGERPIPTSADMGTMANIAFKAFAGDMDYDPGRNIADRAKEIISGFEAFAAKQSKEDAKRESEKSDSPVRSLKEIVRNTLETASNTRQQLDLSRYAIGGGDVGKIGMTPIEMRRAKNVNIKVTGADESLNKLFQDFLRQALPMVVQR